MNMTGQEALVRAFSAGTVDHVNGNGNGATPMGGEAPQPRRTAWHFLSNHARVLAALSDDAEIRLRDVADQVGITERAAQSIVADLANAGFVTRTRVGRRNRYEVHRDAVIEEGDRRLTVADLLDALTRPQTREFVEVGYHRNGNSQN